MPSDSIRVTDVVVRDRIRRDVGNVLGLAESIQRLGLFHPIVINTRKELVAGARRLAAVKKLGWKEVPCRFVATLDDAIAALQAERDENTCREPLTPSEMVEIGRRLEALEKPKAKERQAKAGPQSGKGKKTGSGKLPEPVAGDTRDKVAAALGVSGKTYEKAKQVAEAAEKEPTRYGDLPAKMDATGKVDPVHRELKARQESLEALAPKPTVPIKMHPARGPLAEALELLNAEPLLARAAELVRQALKLISDDRG
jgi:ParB/RepB/Spo0J family partition protein